MKASDVLNNIPQAKIDDLREYIKEKVANLNRIDILNVSWNPFATTIELMATKKAIKILTEILGEFMAYSVQTPKTQDPRDSYLP